MHFFYSQAAVISVLVLEKIMLVLHSAVMPTVVQTILVTNVLFQV